MNANLKAKLREQFRFAQASAMEFAADKYTRVVKVIDNLMFIDNWHGEAHIGTSVYDKENLDILTLKKREGKGVFTVTDVADNYWSLSFTYFKPEMEALERSYTGGTYDFANKVRDRRAKENVEARRQKASHYFESMKPLTSEIKADFEKILLRNFEFFVYDAKTKLGECSTCGNTARIVPQVRHKAIGKCPVCGGNVTFLAKGKLACHYHEQIEIAWLFPVGDDLMIRYFTVCGRRDKGNILNPVVTIYEMARQIIRGKSHKIDTFKSVNGVWDKVDLNKYRSNWYSYTKPWISTWGNYGVVYSDASEVKSFLGCSEFKYSGLDTWLGMRPSETYAITAYLQTWFKFPQLEWLVKSGFKELAMELVSHSTRCNFQFKTDAKNLPEWLHLNRTLWKEILPFKETISFASITDKIAYPKQNVRELIEVREKFNANLSLIGEILDVTTLHKALRYLSENDFRLDIWLDYLRLRKMKEGFDRNNSMIVFPRYLKEAHDEMLRWEYKNKIQLAKAKHADMLAKLHEVAINVTKQFEFSQGKYLMTVPQTGDEIIQEGEMQHICVGRFSMPYMENMSLGIGFVLFVREKEAPNKSFFTVEVRDGKVLQVRGKYNSAPSDEVRQFITEFAQAKQLVCKY